MNLGNNIIAFSFLFLSILVAEDPFILVAVYRIYVKIGDSEENQDNKFERLINPR